MLNEFHKIIDFIKRDFKIMYTYKLAFYTSFITVVFNLFYFIFFGSMFGSRFLAELNPYGGDFISYLIVGSMGWGFLWGIMGTTASSIRSEMMMGTLESLMLTSTKLSTMMISYTIFGSFFGLITMGILTAIGYFFYGIVIFANASIFTIIIFFLSGTMMMGFGMLFGGLTIWLKNVGGTIPLIQNISMLFCGVYFPLTVLPYYLQPIGKFIPFYYSIEGLRLSLVPSTSFNEMIFFVIILLILSVFSVSIGLFTTKKALKKAKKDGSLTFY